MDSPTEFSHTEGREPDLYTLHLPVIEYRLPLGRGYDLEKKKKMLLLSYGYYLGDLKAES